MKAEILRRVGGLPFVQLHIKGDDRSFLALLDTGCERTLVDAELIGNDVLSGGTCAMLTGFGGSDEFPGFEVSLDVTIGGADVKTDVLVTDISEMMRRLRSRTPNGRGRVAMIIGTDVLSAIGAVIDIEAGTLTFNGKDDGAELQGGGKLFSVDMRLTYDLSAEVHAACVKDAAWKAAHGIQPSSCPGMNRTDPDIAYVKTHGGPHLSIIGKPVKI